MLGTNSYDRAASLLISLLILVGMIVGGLFVIWLTGRLMFTKQPVKVELVEYAGRGDHAEGFARDKEAPGPQELEEEMYEPQVEVALEAVTEVVTTQVAALDAISVAADVAAKGGGGLGDSRPPGPEGEGSTDIIPPWERWEIRYTTSGIDPYARQLDFFKIELAAAGGAPEVDYALNLAKPKPDRRSGKPEDEKRIYMSWQGTSPLAAFDRQLLGRAGIKTDRRMVLQFYPRETELKLLQLEAENGKGHTAKQFFKTIFGVRAARQGYEFYVIDQYFRPGPP
jgi:hypothetical protein